MATHILWLYGVKREKKKPVFFNFEIFGYSYFMAIWYIYREKILFF